MAKAKNASAVAAAPTDPSQPAPAKAPAKPKVLIAGLSKKNPLVPFVDQIMRSIIFPQVKASVESFNGNIPSAKALTDRFNSLTGCKTSTVMFKAWLKYLGYTFRTQPQLVPIAAEGAAPAPAADGKEAVEFDKQPAMAGGPV